MLVFLLLTNLPLIDNIRILISTLCMHYIHSSQRSRDRQMPRKATCLYCSTTPTVIGGWFEWSKITPSVILTDIPQLTFPGYLPAETIETPQERLARLNKHRNIDVSILRLCCANASSLRQSCSKIIHRRVDQVVGNHSGGKQRKQ